jgi:hypothetical protein
LILDHLFFHATLGKETTACRTDKVQEWRPGEQERDDRDGNDEGDGFVRHVISPDLIRGGLGNGEAWLSLRRKACKASQLTRIIWFAGDDFDPRTRPGLASRKALRHLQYATGPRSRPHQFSFKCNSSRT